MTGTVSPDLPTIGTGRSVADAKLRGSLITLRDSLNAVLTSGNQVEAAAIGGAIDTSQIADNAVFGSKLKDNGASDAKLMSPNNSVYKTIAQAVSTGGNPHTSGMASATTGTYFFGFGTFGGAIQGPGLVASGIGTGTVSQPAGLIYFDDADYTVGSLTQKLRVRMQVMVGSTSPSTVTFTAGLYPVTISAGNWTLGTVVSGTTALSSSLATNTISSFASSDATIPSDGVYALGVVVGSITVPAGIHLSVQLQTRNV